MANRLLNLQALRGLACLMVVGYHVADSELRRGLSPERAVLYPLSFFGYAGVDLFFALSGFVITWAHLDQLGKPARLPGYLGKRLWRIYPVYWLCWFATGTLFYLVLGLTVYHPDDYQYALRSLLLWPQAAPNYFVPVAWSLVYEVMFYAAFAAFFLLPRRWFVPGLAAWALAVAYFTFVGRPSHSPLRRLPVEPLVLEFLAGCLAAVLARRDRPAGAGRCVALGVAGFATGAVLNALGITDTALDNRQRVLVFGVPSALLVYGLVARERGGARPLPRWLRSLGDASYSIYLVHGPVFELIHHWQRGMSHRLLPHLGWVAANLTAAVGVGYLVHVAAERPLLNAFRRRKPAPATLPVPEPAVPLRRSA
jgi:peptidoglycan/LPS O-acetylase OafA/YrhL